MSRKCSCPAGYRHQQLGKERKELAAEYPADLCREYAELVVKAGKRAVDLEWWRVMVANKCSEVLALQVKWLESKEKQQPRAGWPTRVFEKTRQSTNKVSMRGLRDEETHLAVGGMRNPWAAVRRLSKVAKVGRDCARLWRRFVRENPM